MDLVLFNLLKARCWYFWTMLFHKTKQSKTWISELSLKSQLATPDPCFWFPLALMKGRCKLSLSQLRVTPTAQVNSAPFQPQNSISL